MSWDKVAKVGLEGGKMAYKQYRESQKPKFANTQLGKYYANKKVHGLYGSQGVQNMANQYGKFMNRGKDDNISNVKGNLISKGMDNSIAGISTINKFNSGTDTKIADYYNKVYNKNEASKDDASLQYAQGFDKSKMDTFNAKTNNMNDFLSSTANTLMPENEKNDLNSILGSLGKNEDGSDDIQPIINYLTEKGYAQEEIINYIKTL